MGFPTPWRFPVVPFSAPDMFINYCRHWTIRFYSLAYFAVSGLIWSVSWEKVAIERASITPVPPRYLSPALRGPTGDNQGTYQQYVDSHINDMSDEQLSAVVWWLMTVFLTATPRIPVSEGERPVPEWPGGQYQPVGISEFQKIKWNLWKDTSLFNVPSLTLKVPVAPRGWAGEIWLFTCVKVWPFNKWMLKQCVFALFRDSCIYFFLLFFLRSRSWRSASLPCVRCVSTPTPSSRQRYNLLRIILNLSYQEYFSVWHWKFTASLNSWLLFFLGWTS